MKNYNLKTIIRNRPYLFITVLLIVSLQACSNKIKFLKSAVVPAAEGSLKLKQDDNKNYKIEVNVETLAKPERLTPPKKVYILWIDTESNGTKNVGQLNVSNSLNSSLNTVTAFKPKRIFITGEDSANVQSPNPQTVLDTGIIE